MPTPKEKFIVGTEFEIIQRQNRERQSEQPGLPQTRYGLPVYPNAPETPTTGPWNSDVKWTAATIAARYGANYRNVVISTQKPCAVETAKKV